MRFWSATKTYRSCEYEMHMDTMRIVYQQAYNYQLQAIGMQHYSNSFVERWRYDMLTQNIAECLIKLVMHNRELLITKTIRCNS